MEKCPKGVYCDFWNSKYQICTAGICYLSPEKKQAAQPVYRYLVLVEVASLTPCIPARVHLFLSDYPTATEAADHAYNRVINGLTCLEAHAAASIAAEAGGLLPIAATAKPYHPGRN